MFWMFYGVGSFCVSTTWKDENYIFTPTILYDLCLLHCGQTRDGQTFLRSGAFWGRCTCRGPRASGIVGRHVFSGCDSSKTCRWFCLLPMTRRSGMFPGVPALCVGHKKKQNTTHTHTHGEFQPHFKLQNYDNFTWKTFI